MRDVDGDALEKSAILSLAGAMLDCSCCLTDLIGPGAWQNELLAESGFEHGLCESCSRYLQHADERLVNLMLLQLALAQADPVKLKKLLAARLPLSPGNRKEIR